MAKSASPLKFIDSVAVRTGYGLKRLNSAEGASFVVVLFGALHHTFLAHQYRAFVIATKHSVDSILVAYLTDSIVLV